MRHLGLDRPLITVVFLLSAYGLLTLYSAGQTDVVTQAQDVWIRQLVWMALGVVAAAVVFRFSFRLLEWLAPAGYAFAIILLLITLAVGTGQGTATGTKSWLAIGGHQIGQPAELAKLAVILMLARYLSGLREAPRNLRELVGPCLIAGVPFLLVLKQPDLGSAIVFIGILFLMLFWAGVKPSLLFLLASPGISLFLAFNTWTWGVWMIVLAVLLFAWRPYVAEGVLVYVANSVMGALAIPLWQRLAPYQQNRLLTFLNPEIDPRAAGYHAIQSRVAIGSGGWLGNGFTEGPQKRLAFLPAQHTDFIFSVVGEELGFLGVLVALALFLALFLVVLRIARRATDPFASLAAFGVLALFFTHVFENVGMTVNLMPITGIPLPFFSYGGSFFLVCCVAVGLLLRAAWDARLSGYADV
ncbi:MAG TPA: rod shape-determining protein RodA [Gemmatimonadales bacterium]|jgi:rod shape determining protein RodA|nr:rod shape-determining protein RodA [Gemmatimonadales bacterium]